MSQNQTKPIQTEKVAELKVQTLKLRELIRVGTEQVTSISFSEDESQNKFTLVLNKAQRTALIKLKREAKSTLVPFETISYIQYYGEYEINKTPPSSVAGVESSPNASEGNPSGAVQAAA